MRLTLLLVFLALLYATPITHAQNASNGCGTSNVAVSSENRTFTSGDLTREYSLYLPESYDGNEAFPLVITLHGFLNSRQQIADWSKWGELAEEENFIAVFPQGAGTPTRWNAGNAGFIGDYDVDDVAFIGGLIDALSRELCVDAAQIYVNGLSNGGGMTNRLACELSDVVAAVGTVSGAYTSWDEECTPTRPVPVIAFHGTEDTIVPFEGTRSGDFPSVQSWALNWAQRNGCDSAAVSVPVNVAINATVYPGCNDSADVILYVIEGGDHVWPGDDALETLFGDGVSHQIDATAMMWAFFKAHPKPAAS